jgi:hypothetical protein
VKCPIFLSDFEQTFIFYWNFQWSPQYQILRKSLSWCPRWCMRRAGQRDEKREGRTDMNQTDAFRCIATRAWRLILRGIKLVKGIEVAQVWGLFPIHSNEVFVYGLKSFSRKSIQTILHRSGVLEGHSRTRVDGHAPTELQFTLKIFIVQLTYLLRGAESFLRS